jgi:hypothetical protein
LLLLLLLLLLLGNVILRFCCFQQCSYAAVYI